MERNTSVTAADAEGFGKQRWGRYEIMSATELHIESQIEQLLEVLRGDLSQMQENMARLDSVRELVIKRDIIGLEKLLEEIKKRCSAI